MINQAAMLSVNSSGAWSAMRPVGRLIKCSGIFAAPVQGLHARIWDYRALKGYCNYQQSTEEEL